MEINALPPAAKVHLRDVGALTAIKTTPGALMALQVVNTIASALYVQLFDAPVASVTLGTTRPDMELLIGASSFFNAVLPAGGIAFGSAITIAITAGTGVEVFAQYSADV
jgi:hypothetical protein